MAGVPILDPHYWSTHEGSVVLDVSTAAAAVENYRYSGKVRGHVYVRRGQSYKGHKGGHEQIML